MSARDITDSFTSPTGLATDTTPIKRLIQSLDRTDRYIVMLHYADGLTINEVGLVLDLPPRVVESALQRLRGKLLLAINQAEHTPDGPPMRRRGAA